MTDTADHWLSVEEIGKYLGVSSDAVYRWTNKHTMLFHRMNRLWKFQKDEVGENWRCGGRSETGSS